ncbi:DUF5317 family protein [Frankia sp. AgB32]|uniref:DUF5317 family protein n=1 Tax=Frankia sp. AgB32 TaxID=631119 RepID=UPI00201095AD|nr:DUF5317 family protein [Frankia sp. AgB32]MCK9894895.1 DUF5317 domain-containing protein [Frankia sp. AgB32]
MLVLVVLTLVCGLGVGLARGGTLGALARVHVYRPWLFAVLVLVLAVGGLVPALHSPAWIVAAVLAALFAGMNNRLPGLGLLLAGIIANAAAIAANGGQMPVSLWGARHAGVPIEDILTSAFHTPAGGGTSLRLLSDVIPFPFPGVPAVVSIGDVAIAAALGVFGAVTPVRARRTLQARRNAALAGALPASYGGTGRPVAPGEPGDDAVDGPPVRRGDGDPLGDTYDAFDDTYDDDGDGAYAAHTSGEDSYGRDSYGSDAYDGDIHDADPDDGDIHDADPDDADPDDTDPRDLAADDLAVDDRDDTRVAGARDGTTPRGQADGEGDDWGPDDDRADPVRSLDAERDSRNEDNLGPRPVTARRRGLAR